MTTTPQPSPDDERYRVPGTNIMDWTKFSRENIPKGPPKFAVDDEVVVVGVDHVVSVGQDCDGTPLFRTANHGGNYSANSLIPLPDDFVYDFNSDLIGSMRELTFALRALGWTVEPPNGRAVDD